MPTGRPSGRPAMPVERKRALGNPGHRPLPEPPPPGQGLAGVSDIPEPPPMGPDGMAMWENLWTAGKTWLSPEGDGHLVEMLCQAYDESSMLRRALAIGEIPRHYVLPNGSYVTHPYVTQLKELRVQITAWLSQLGFSPSDRARLGLAQVKTYGALDELQRRRDERMRDVS
jgi:P27 family predicted phage terminase small subunit